MKTALPSLIALFLTSASSFGLTLFHNISSPEHCPSFLKIDALPSDKNDGSFAVRVRFSPEAPELYEGRIKAFGRLTVKADDQFMAETKLVSSQDGELFQFGFRLGSAAFEQSELVLSTHLHERDGVQTVGGGHIYRVRLKGFLPEK